MFEVLARLVRVREQPEHARFHFPSKPVLLTTRKSRTHVLRRDFIESNQDSEEVRCITLQELVETQCPSLFNAYRPLWWLFNGHLQTIYNIFGDFSKQDHMWYNRQYLRLADGGTIGLDFTPVDSAKLGDETPIIVVQHGLTGGSHEAYLRAILSTACKPAEEGGLGYRAVIVTFRGCAGVPITSPRLYTAGHTDDLHQALIYVSHRFPRAPLLGLGFSLGANILTRYVAEEGDRCRLSSALEHKQPWDLEKNGYALEGTFVGKNIWARGMGHNFLRLIRRHQKSLAADPSLPISSAVSSALALRYPTLSQFDDAFTRLIGDNDPPFPFPSVALYYRWASSHHVVDDIKIPFMAINAEDDPVTIHAPMDGNGNPNVVMILTKTGGHLGWFQSGQDSKQERWTTKPAIEWFKAMAEHVVHPQPKIAEVIEDEDGFLREAGRSHLGCRPVEGGGLINGNAGNLNLVKRT